MDLPSTARAASPMVSESVGWGWTAAPISQAVASSSMAAEDLPISSVNTAASHVHAQQLIGLRIRDDLDEPCGVALDGMALPDAIIGILPTFVLMPRSAHCSEVMPIQANCGGE